MVSVSGGHSWTTASLVLPYSHSFVKSLTSFALVIGLSINWAGQSSSVKSAARGTVYNIFETNKILYIQSVDNKVISLIPPLEILGPGPVQ